MSPPIITINQPITALVVIVLLSLVHAVLWFRVLQKTEMQIGIPIFGAFCAFISAFFAPLLLVPLLIAALAPWPVRKPRSVKIRRN